MRVTSFDVAEDRDPVLSCLKLTPTSNAHNLTAIKTNATVGGRFWDLVLQWLEVTLRE